MERQLCEAHVEVPITCIGVIGKYSMSAHREQNPTETKLPRRSLLAGWLVGSPIIIMMNPSPHTGGPRNGLVSVRPGVGAGGGAGYARREVSDPLQCGWAPEVDEPRPDPAWHNSSAEEPTSPPRQPENPAKSITKAHSRTLGLYRLVRS